MSEGLELHGRRAFVTGGTQGIGEAVVARLPEAGAKVLTTARTAPAGLPDPDLFVAADVATTNALQPRPRFSWPYAELNI